MRCRPTFVKRALLSPNSNRWTHLDHARKADPLSGTGLSQQGRLFEFPAFARSCFEDRGSSPSQEFIQQGYAAVFPISKIRPCCQPNAVPKLYTV